MSRDRPPLTPGVYRVADAVGAGDALGRAGWDVRRAAAARSTAELYPALATALALPSWFGANLDALWDCLADLDRPTALVLTGWDHFAAAEPDDARRLLALFAERVRADPPFVVALAAGGTGAAGEDRIRTDGGPPPRPARSAPDVPRR